MDPDEFVQYLVGVMSDDTEKTNKSQAKSEKQIPRKYQLALNGLRSTCNATLKGSVSPKGIEIKFNDSIIYDDDLNKVDDFLAGLTVGCTNKPSESALICERNGGKSKRIGISGTQIDACDFLNNESFRDPEKFSSNTQNAFQNIYEMRAYGQDGDGTPRGYVASMWRNNRVETLSVTPDTFRGWYSYWMMRSINNDNESLQKILRNRTLDDAISENRLIGTTVNGNGLIDVKIYSPSMHDGLLLSNNSARIVSNVLSRLRASSNITQADLDHARPILNRARNVSYMSYDNIDANVFNDRNFLGSMILNNFKKKIESESEYSENKRYMKREIAKINEFLGDLPYIHM